MEKTSFLRRLATLAPVLLVLVSCAPQAFVIRPEMRTASKSGLNLMGKSMGVVYLTGKETAVNEFNEAIADGFASRLEEDYFGGQQEIGLFKMPAIDGADYSVKDSLIKLVLESGKDVVFLFIADESSPQRVYDGMIVSMKGHHYRLNNAQASSLRQKWGFPGIPSYVIVGKDGSVKDFHTGFKGVDYYRAKIERELN